MLGKQPNAFPFWYFQMKIFVIFHPHGNFSLRANKGNNIGKNKTCDVFSKGQAFTGFGPIPFCGDRVG